MPLVLANGRNNRAEISGATPGGFGWVFAGGSVEMGGLFVAHPLQRLQIGSLDWTGAGSLAIPIGASDVGTTRFYQGFFRAGLMHTTPGAFGPSAVLTNALRVVFAP